ncbi:MAG: NADH-quinone oxidoreductase subunit L, partial [Acidobacteriota bacterium]
SLYRLISNKYWVDELYDAVIVQPYYFLCRRSFDFDTWVIDGTIHVTAAFADIAGNIARLFQTGYVRNYALYFFIGVVVIVLYFLS